jgi:hypothetical protein
MLVFYDGGGFKLSKWFERQLQVLFGDLVGQISYIDIHSDLLL